MSGGGGGGEAEHGDVIAELRARIATLEHERDEYRKLYLLVREQYEKLKRGLLGQKAERLGRGGENAAQLTLALLGMLLGEAETAPAAAAAIEVPAHQRRQLAREDRCRRICRTSRSRFFPRRWSARGGTPSSRSVWRAAMCSSDARRRW